MNNRKYKTRKQRRSNKRTCNNKRGGKYKKRIAVATLAALGLGAHRLYNKYNNKYKYNENLKKTIMDHIYKISDYLCSMKKKYDKSNSDSNSTTNTEHDNRSRLYNEEEIKEICSQDNIVNITDKIFEENTQTNTLYIYLLSLSNLIYSNNRGNIPTFKKFGEMTIDEQKTIFVDFFYKLLKHNINFVRENMSQCGHVTYTRLFNGLIPPIELPPL